MYSQCFDILLFQPMVDHVRHRLIVVQSMRSVFLVYVHVRPDITLCHPPTRVNAVSLVQYNETSLSHIFIKHKSQTFNLI